MSVRSILPAFLIFVLGCSSAGPSAPTATVPAAPPTAAGPVLPAEGNPPEEVARLRGTWSGTVLAGDAPAEVTVEFTHDEIRITQKGQTRSRPYVLDAKQDPKWLDLVGSLKSDPPQPTTLGIYEIDGDQLRISLGTPVTRPAEFGGKGITTAVYLLKRN
jgi:uncharacterized protein (TIGR03067 family)